MPYFSVMMEGKGINIPSDDGSAPIVGFFTTRMVRTASAEDAENKAKEMILLEWSSGPYAKSNKGALPSLLVESVTKKTLRDYLSFKNKGYSFYIQEEKND